MECLFPVCNVVCVLKSLSNLDIIIQYPFILEMTGMFVKPPFPLTYICHRLGNVASTEELQFSDSIYFKPEQCAVYPCDFQPLVLPV